MHAWRRPDIPELPGHSDPPKLFDTASQDCVVAEADTVARLYVCGITPYDATHIGHAATYLAFDILQRVWLDAGYEVHYAQNVTDVDDPLLERASAIGVDWRTLADEQIELFRSDMASLGVIPPDDYVAVTEMIDPIVRAVSILCDRELAYEVPTPDADGSDIYFDTAAAAAVSPWALGDESNLDRNVMLALFAERGGDPDREGKRDRLDPLLWRASREGEPSWPSELGPGRPGWHIECSVIALKFLGTDFAVQGGGSDLIFPHHEMSAGHAAALSGHPLARVFSHTGLVAYEGEKMSKSLGNLVLVSQLRQQGVDPRAIRLAILANPYRTDWEWSDAVLSTGRHRLQAWLDGVGNEGSLSSTTVLTELRSALGDDLDTPRALSIIDRALADGVDDPGLVASAVHALLGVRLLE